MRRLNDKLGYEAPQRADLVAVRAAIAVVTAADATAQSTADAAVTAAATAQATADASTAALVTANAAIATLQSKAYFYQGTATFVAGQVTVAIPNIPGGVKVDSARQAISGTILLGTLGDIDFVVAGSGAGTTITLRSRLVALGVLSINTADTSMFLFTIWP